MGVFGIGGRGKDDGEKGKLNLGEPKSPKSQLAKARKLINAFSMRRTWHQAT